MISLVYLEGSIPFYDLPKYFLCFLHPFDDGNAKGTACLAATAGDAVFCVLLQALIMSAHRRRYFRLHRRQVIQFIDHGNVDMHGTGRAMAAIHAMPAPADSLSYATAAITCSGVSKPTMTLATPGLVSA